MRVLDFKDHRRELDGNRYLYAVVSRRARGVSLGVNLNPDKVCNFDCPYCQVDRTLPGGPPEIDVPGLVSELDSLLSQIDAGTLWGVSPFDTAAPGLRRVADIAFSGDGEPTTPPAFATAAEAVRQARDCHHLEVPMRLITNATTFDRPRVRQALGFFDELWCKLDAGTAEYFAKVDGTRFSFGRILANLTAVARQRPIVIQSMFPSFDGEGPEPAEIEAYLARLQEILAAGGAIAGVQVYTVARKPADARVGPLPGERLEAIAGAVRGLGLQAEVFGDEP